MFHPFYVKNEDGTGQWKAASNLEAGDELLTEDGKKVFVSEVRVEKLEEEITVYNLELDEVHTYYVALGVLVHNMCATNKNKKENAAGSAGESGNSSREIILSTEKTHESARNTLISELQETGAFKNGSDSYVGRLESSYGYGKQIGRQSLDGKVRWRLDFDDKIGVHYNIENFMNGKGAKAIKKVIPIEISYDEYIKILNGWN